MAFNNPQLEPLLQLILAVVLGGLIGLEREYKRKEAGLKTFALVGLASCFFALLDTHLAGLVYSSSVKIDPSRIIQAVAIGVGFIGAGLIIYRRFQVEGLTTAAALWAAAAVGVGIGLKMYFLSIFCTALIIAILAAMRLLEEKIFHKFPEDENDG